MLDRIENTANFTRRNARLTRFAVGAVTVFLGLRVLSLAAGKKAGDAVGRAAAESSRAQTALDARKQAESTRDSAVAQANASRVQAEADKRLATQASLERRRSDDLRAKAELQRTQAEAETKRQQQLASDATKERQQAEKRP